MNTLKTAAVVVLLLAVLYGVYVVLNKPEESPPAEIGWQQAEEMAPPEIDFGIPGGGDGPYAASNPITPPVQVAAASETADPQSQGGSPADSAAPIAPPFPDAQQISQPSMPDFSAGQAGAGSDGQAGPPQPPTSQYGEPTSTQAGPQESDASQFGARAFEKAWRTAEAQIEDEQWREALFTLSIFYNSPDLTSEENRQLLKLLDPLAGKVIYSTEHLLEPAYQVRRGETLMDIAERYSVPWQLLKNINGVEDPRVLVPGTPLKIVPGPFRAEVDLEAQELTLFVGRLYAGRFPISLGQDPAPQPGEYQVRDKQQDRSYYTSDGRTIPPGDQNNPLGRAWLDLGGEFCIHGSPESETADSELGCISLSPIDADDVYGILSVGSKVLIRR